MKLYAIRNAKSNFVKMIFESYSDDYAVLEVKQIFAESPFGFHCPDEELIRIGEFNDSTGIIFDTSYGVVTPLEPIWKEVCCNEVDKTV